MNMSVLDNAARKGRIFAKREKWVEPVTPAKIIYDGHSKAPTPQFKTFNEVVEMHSKRDVYGFRTAPGYDIEPRTLDTMTIHEGLGVTSGGKNLERVTHLLQTRRPGPSVTDPVYGNEIAPPVQQDATTYSAEREFRAVF